MDLTPLLPRGRQLIQAYGGGGFAIAGVRHVGSVLVFPDRTEAWPIESPAQVTAESLARVAKEAANVEILLLGTGGEGSASEWLLPEVRSALRESGVAFEVLDTGAACRTFNVLLTEDRRAAAALVAVD